MTIKDRLFEILSKTGMSVSRFSKETGIPLGRIYKWRDGDGSPKAEDSKKIEDWLNKIDKKNSSDIHRNTEEIDRLKATINAVLIQVAKQMARDQGRPVNDCIDELEQSSDVILREIKKGK